MRQIHLHIIHCSDSLKGDVGEIRRWHLARGWKDVGYHFIIRRDGEIEVGRTLDEIGSHCEGYNTPSVGTCLVGKTSFTEAQFKALRRIDVMLRALFPNLQTKPHCALNTHGKTCPNFDINPVLKG